MECWIFFKVITKLQYHNEVKGKGNTIW